MIHKVEHKKQPTVPVEDMVQGICAIHLSSYVQSPYRDRGGLMIVGPAGVLKTTMLDVLDDNYHNALSISNAYMQTMRKMAPAFYNNQIRSLSFPDIQSIYAGDPRTSGRIEQMMMQLSAEATRTIAGDQDSRFSKFKGYCTIFGAMTPEFYQQHIERWEGSGFMRRFLWSTYTLSDPDVLMRAIERWCRADMGSIRPPALPTSGIIQDTLDTKERIIIRSWLRYQPGPHELQFQVLCKATAALRWWYRKIKLRKDAMDTMASFALTLGHDAALLEFPPQFYDEPEWTYKPRKKKRK